MRSQESIYTSIYAFDTASINMKILSNLAKKKKKKKKHFQITSTLKSMLSTRICLHELASHFNASLPVVFYLHSNWTLIFYRKCNYLKNNPFTPKSCMALMSCCCVMHFYPLKQPLQLKVYSCKSNAHCHRHAMMMPTPYKYYKDYSKPESEKNSWAWVLSGFHLILQWI